MTLLDRLDLLVLSVNKTIFSLKLNFEEMAHKYPSKDPKTTNSNDEMDVNTRHVTRTLRIEIYRKLEKHLF